MSCNEEEGMRNEVGKGEENRGEVKEDMKRGVGGKIEVNRGGKERNGETAEVMGREGGREECRERGRDNSHTQTHTE